MSEGTPVISDCCQDLWQSQQVGGNQAPLLAGCSPEWTVQAVLACSQQQPQAGALSAPEVQWAVMEGLPPTPQVTPEVPHINYASI